VRWSDPQTDKVRSSIGIEVTTHDDGTGSVQLTYTLTQADGQKIPLDYTVRLVTTRPHIGGRRWLFICPIVKNGVPCVRRVAKLYRNGRYFGCRVCHGLAYRSSQEAHQAERNERMLGRIIAKYVGRRRLMGHIKSLPSSELLYLIRTLD
jgi:hypothetical protein